MELISIIAYMIDRRLKPRLNFLLRHNPAVALLGPRQSGKTTLALEIARQQSSVYLDLEDENDRAKLTNPSQYLADHWGGHDVRNSAPVAFVERLFDHVSHHRRPRPGNSLRHRSTWKRF